MLSYYPINETINNRPLEFEAWLDYIAQYWMTDEDIVLFSDREAKDMVVQQYDLTNPPVTVDDARLRAIVDYLVNQENWATVNEWEIQPEQVLVTRPPDYVKITIDEEDEYYSLSESYWHILSALNDLAQGAAIDYKDLEPVIGPCEPSVCPETRINSIDEDDSVYRVFIWWQHDQTPVPSFSYQTILQQVPALFHDSKTDIQVGPAYPDDSRKRTLRKVKALRTLMDDLGKPVDLNAAEILYLLAKALAYYFDSVNEPETYEMLPSHVLPVGYYKFIRLGRFKLIFGPDNQLNWLDIGQRWTLKPAILNEAYR